MTVERLFPGTDMVLQVKLEDRDENVVTAGEVALVELRKRDGSTPEGITLPLDLTHVGAGLYESAIGHALGVQVGDVLEALVRSTLGSLQAETLQKIKVVRAPS